VDLSSFRQQFCRLADERAKLEKVFLGRSGMVRGSYITRYMTCGTPGCRCMTEGKKHGPYTYLSFRAGGRTRLVPVPREDRKKVKSLAENYKEFSEARRRWVKVNRAMLDLVGKMEGLRLKEHPGDGK
jgi:hypothetical protein